MGDFEFSDIFVNFVRVPSYKNTFSTCNSSSKCMSISQNAGELATMWVVFVMMDYIAGMCLGANSLCSFPLYRLLFYKYNFVDQMLRILFIVSLVYKTIPLSYLDRYPILVACTLL